MSVTTSVRPNRGAIARYLKIGEDHSRPVAMPPAVDETVRPPREARSGIAGYLKIGNGRPRPVAQPRVTKKTVRPQKAPVIEHQAPVVEYEAPAIEHKAPVRERKAPVRKASSKAPAKASTKVLRCYDCEGEIEPGMDQCPHCALFLDPARLAHAA
jgi:hypothetical protein